jgi:S1-C subfamily serine protease
MTAIDWAIVLLTLALMPLGYRQGFLVGALTLGGFAGGALLGARLAPLLLSDGSESPYAPAVALLGGLVLGAALAIGLEGVGISLRRRLVRTRPLRWLDAVGGAVVLAVLALAVSWVIGAVALNAPALQQYRADIQRSTILSALNERFPPSGPILRALNRITPTPELQGPSADVDAPGRRILGAPGVQAASDSVVRVLGTACGLSIAGSGWVADTELVVTNAHVIAGEDDTRIETREGEALDAIPVVYRPRNDLAVLRVPGLARSPLSLVEEPARGTAGALLGYPDSGDFSAVPARLGTSGEVSSQDSYGRGPVAREMTSFRGRVVSGNSGGPVVDAQGRVLTTVFASAVDSRPPEGLGIPNAIIARALERAGDQTGTGPCA